MHPINEGQRSLLLQFLAEDTESQNRVNQLEVDIELFGAKKSFYNAKAKKIVNIDEFNTREVDLKLRYNEKL